MRGTHKRGRSLERLLVGGIAAAILFMLYQCQPKAPPVFVRVMEPRAFLPLMSVAVPLGRKGAAGFSTGAAAIAAYGAIGVRHGYNWGHACTVDTLVNYGVNCDHHLRSNAARTWNTYVDDCAPNTTEAEVKACVQARAAAFPGRVWLIGNEPDGGDPGYSDFLTPTQAAEKYGELLQTVRTADPTARTYCCGWVVPFNQSTHAADFAAAYQTRWGHPLSADLTGMHFHVYSIIGSTCSTVDTTCLQNKFNSTLNAGLAWRNSNLPGKPARITEFNWTPFANQQTQALMASRLPAMCTSLIQSGAEAYYVYYGVSANEAQWAPNQTSFVLLNLDYSLTQAGTAFGACAGLPPPYP